MYAKKTRVLLIIPKIAAKRAKTWRPWAEEHRPLRMTRKEQNEVDPGRGARRIVREFDEAVRGVG